MNTNTHTDVENGSEKQKYGLILQKVVIAEILAQLARK